MQLSKEELEERRENLRFLQSQPLSWKIENTISRVLEFHQKTDGKCYLSCSGGADSVVLYNVIKDLIDKWQLDIEIPTVFDDTGLEEPSVRAMALSIPNIKVVRPEMSFWQVLTKIGYPVVSKEVSECVNNARKYFDGLRERERERENAARPKYYAHYKKLFGIGEYATKGSKDNGSVAENDLESKSVVRGFP